MQKALYHSFLVLLGFLSVAPCTSAQDLTFRVGATIGRDGFCGPLYDEIARGYEFFFDWLAQQPPAVVTDASGKPYELRMQLRLISHNCTEEGRAAAMTSLIHGIAADPTTGAPAEPPVHLVLGGNGDNALEDALQADAASRLLLHCCTARDTVFHRGLRHVYGLLTPASLYTGTVLRTMALRGLQRVAVVYTRESPLHVQLCEGALAQLRPLGELRPGFSGVLAVNYSAAEAESPGFWPAISARVAAEDADVLIACDGMDRTGLLVHQLRSLGHRLSALWLASSGDVADFLHFLDGHGEYALTTVQWMPNLPYADPDFGTAAQYAAAFTAATGQKPSHYSAAATAGGYVLLTALRHAVSMCSLGNVTGGAGGTEGDAADAFMWNEGALSCVDNQHSALDITGRSGTAILSYVLNTLNMDTFFGPVGFNGYRQNIYHPVIVTQVLEGDLMAVLPLDVADKALVMPIPPNGEVPQERKSWVQSPTGITILTLLLSLGAVCGTLALLMCRGRMALHLHSAHSVELQVEDITVDIPPQVNSDGSCEPGEGVYRGTRVKLVVASELLQPARNRGWKVVDVGQSGPSTVLLDSTRESPGQRQLATGRVFAAKGGAVPSEIAKGGPATAASAAAAAAAETKGITTSPHRTRSGVSDDFSSRQSGLTHSRTLDFAIADGLGFRKQQQPQQQQQQPDMLLLTRPSDMLLLGTSTGRSDPVSPVPIVQGGRTQAVISYATLSQRTRRQILALVWRAVRLQHPRMCPVLGIVWEWPGLLEGGGKVPVLVRQWHEFDSLDRLLENETVPLPLLTKASIAQGVAEGLAYLHAQEPPIVAGPLEASRVIMDKHFSPHLFLRLRNLHPDYGSTVNTSIGIAADGSRAAGKLRALSYLGNRPAAGALARTAVAVLGSPPALVPKAAAAALLPSPLPYVPATATDQAPVATTAVLPFAVTVHPRDDEDEELSRRPPPQRLQSVSVSLLAQQPAPRLTGASVLSDVSEERAFASTVRPVGLFAPPPQYRPSKEQDVYEFGLLLCRIFIVASPEDSGRLRFANVTSAAVAAVSAIAADADCSAAGGTAFYAAGPPPLQPPGGALQPPAAAAVMQTVDLEQLESVLGELYDICPELGDLARACVQPQSGLTFPAVAKALEQVVIPALTGSDGLPRGLRRNPLSVKVYGSIGSGGGGAGSARCGSGGVLRPDRQDLELRSMSSVGVGRSGSSQIVCNRTASATRPDHPRGMRSQQHHLLHHHAVASDDLLFDIFPPKVARALQAGESVQPERYECVSIFFSDVVGYTDLCGQLQPGEVMDLVHRLYSRFDDLIRELRLFKVETVGDAYLAVGNLRWPQPGDHARLMAQFALAAVRAASSLPVHPDRPELGTVHVRVGLHCGPVVGSVVGTLNRRFCLFGDAVNTAARMEHNSEADRINCSAAFAALLREQWPEGPCAVSRGVRQVKGKGAMELFWLVDGQPGGGAATEGSPRSATKQGLS